MIDERRFDVKRRKGVCTERWETKSRDNIVISQCTSSKT